MKLKAIIATIFLIACSVNSQNQITNPSHAVLPPDFNKMSYDEANDAVNSECNLIVARKAKKIDAEYVTNLVYQLRQGNLTDDKKVLVIYFLGELRPSDTNSVEVLLEYIDLMATRFDPKTDIQRWGLYPAEEALTKIGKPTVNPILNHLVRETNGLRRHLMCEVLRHAEGEQAAQVQIKQKLADTQTNLEAALNELEK